MPYRARLFAVALVLSVFSWDSFAPRTWIQTAGEVSRSIVFITYPTTVYDPWDGEASPADAACSGFVIDSRNGIVLTATHCLNRGTANALTVDGLADVEVLWYDFKLDIAVLKVPGLRKPALAPRHADAAKGQEVATVGHGYGLADTLFGHMWISSLRSDFGNLEGEWLVVYGGFIGGQSGSPIFDLDGRVVGIVQRSDGITGLSLPMDDLWALTKDYWEYPRIKAGEVLHEGVN